MQEILQEILLLVFHHQDGQFVVQSSHMQEILQEILLLVFTQRFQHFWAYLWLHWANHHDLLSLERSLLPAEIEHRPILQIELKPTIYYFLETEEGEVTDSCSDDNSDNEDRISRNILEKLGICSTLHK